jgi:hypothetical protein
MDLHRSRYGVGENSVKPGRWYVWAGPRLIGFLERNSAAAGPNWFVFAHEGPPGEPRRIGEGRRSLDEGIADLVNSRLAG